MTARPMSTRSSRGSTSCGPCSAILRSTGGRGAGTITTHLLSLAQTLLVAQVGVGLLLLADDRRAPEQLHYLYGTLALAVALAPWFYAPDSGPRRLLWFAGTTAVAGALAIRAFMTGTS